MSPPVGQAMDVLDSPHLLIDLDMVDANVRRMLHAVRNHPVNVRVHFKSLKCGGLARYLAAAGVRAFLCAKLNEAEVLADAGLTDLFIANQVVGPIKLRRLVEVVTGAGTGTGEFVGAHEAVTEIQPGSFVLMDRAYHEVRPEFGCALSVLATVISRRPGRYVLDAGSKAVSQDFGTPVLKGR